MDSFQIRKQFEEVFGADEQAGAQSHKSLIGVPQYRASDTATVEAVYTDDEAEYVVTRIEFSTSAGLNFYLTDGTTRKSITYFSGANSGDSFETWLPMGKGKAIAYTSSGGTLSIRVTALVRRYTTRKRKT